MTRHFAAPKTKPMIGSLIVGTGACGFSKARKWTPAQVRCPSICERLNSLRRCAIAFDGKRDFMVARFHQVAHGLLLPIRATHHNKR